MSEFKDRTEHQRFELVFDDGIAFATYRDFADKRAIMHVETPAHMRGRGVAAELMDEIVAWARAGDKKLIPRCSYAVHYFEAKPEAGDVAA
jgi:predicted GNAT family acetyltransferase